MEIQRTIVTSLQPNGTFTFPDAGMLLNFEVKLNLWRFRVQDRTVDSTMPLGLL